MKIKLKNKNEVLNRFFKKNHPETLQEASELLEDELDIKVSVSYLSKWFKENGYIKIGPFGSLYSKMYRRRNNRDKDDY